MDMYGCVYIYMNLCMYVNGSAVIFGVTASRGAERGVIQLGGKKKLKRSLQQVVVVKVMASTPTGIRERVGIYIYSFFVKRCPVHRVCLCLHMRVCRWVSVHTYGRRGWRDAMRVLRIG